jgi:hypothetical protein
MTLPWVVAAIGIVLAWTLALGARQPAPAAEEFFGRPRKKPLKRSSTWQWGALLFGAMVLGILARYFWELLGRGEPVAAIDAAEMIRPLLVSPLVFFPVWSQAAGKTRTFATILIAFQNGFFWQAVFEKQAP